MVGCGSVRGCQGVSHPLRTRVFGILEAVPVSAMLAVGLGGPSVGARIREARVARGWSIGGCARRYVALRAEAGERLDVANLRSQWSKWENGHHLPDRLSQASIAQVFGVPVEVIFGLTTEAELPRPILLEAHVTTETILSAASEGCMQRSSILLAPSSPRSWSVPTWRPSRPWSTSPPKPSVPRSTR